MKRSFLAASLLSATLLVGACGSTSSDDSGAALTTIPTSTSTPSTSTVTSQITAVEEPAAAPASSSAAAAAAAAADEPYSFPGYRQTCEEALKMLAGFEELNKQWGSEAPELDQTVEMEKLLAEIEKEAEFTAMSKSEQDQFRKAFRAAATGRC
ncbi:hypothetical protein P9990_17460 [Prescottella equi]|uniref:hypothetical protein n=1 Tax=Rhodococcus hoagii TaxID=43767 RepID=UPI0025787047|nr:hypothetical protein [Prescottella equi]WJJ10359.1 hypothetical protein P9990_17460 [Prescottella equi]